MVKYSDFIGMPLTLILLSINYPEVIQCHPQQFSAVQYFDWVPLLTNTIFLDM